MTTIRRLDPTKEAYERVSALLSIVHPSVPRSDGDVLRWFWAHMTQRGHSHQWVIAENDRLLGFARICDAWSHGDGNRATAFIAVHPDVQRRGHGGRLLRRCVAAYDGLTRKTLIMEGMEDSAGAEPFLTAHGFTPWGRFLISAFDTRTPVPDFALRRLDALFDAGMEVLDGVEYSQRFPLDWRERWWRMECQAREDMPGPEPSRPVHFENFCHKFEMPGLDLSAFHFVIDGDDLVAMTGFKVFRLDPLFGHIWMTMVARTHRRRGLATAIKAHSLRVAKIKGIRWVRTDNEETNHTWQLNQAFGFTPQPAKILYASTFDALRARFGLSLDSRR